MDTATMSALEVLALVFLLGFFFGRVTKKDKRNARKSTAKKTTARPMPSAPPPLTRVEMQRMYPTAKQEALVDDMKAKGLLTAFDIDLLRSNRNRRFYSDLIDKHIVEYRKVVAEQEAHKKAQKEKAAAAAVPFSAPAAVSADSDKGLEKGKWLDFEHLPPLAEFPIVLRDGLFSKREYAFYRVLRRSCDKKGLKVCPKVRLADILDVKTEDTEENRVWFRTIAQLHVDFLILGKNDRFLFGIELDDSTHDNPEAWKKDRFKDECFNKTTVGLFRCREIMSDADMDKWIDEHIEIAAVRKALKS